MKLFWRSQNLISTARAPPPYLCGVNFKEKKHKSINKNCFLYYIYNHIGMWENSYEGTLFEWKIKHKNCN